MKEGKRKGERGETGEKEGSRKGERRPTERARNGNGNETVDGVDVGKGLERIRGRVSSIGQRTRERERTKTDERRRKMKS